MPELFRPSFKDKKTGRTRTTRCWYARIQGRRIPLKVTDRRIAERKAVQVECQLELGHDPEGLERARRQPLADHLLAFEESLRAKRVGTRHLETILPRLRLLIAGCGFRTLADTDPAKVEAWLAVRKSRGHPISAQCRKHYLVHALQFGRFLIQTGRAARNPFAGLRTDLNVQGDRRHERRALTEVECQTLLSYVRTSCVRRGRMSGEDRYFLLSLAIQTGYRRNELGSLVPESFLLDADLPSVTLSGSCTKNGRVAVLPLRRDLADELRGWLRDKAAGRPVFPVKDKQINKVIHKDLVAAGIPRVVQGRCVDFHALRYTFVSLLALSGVPLTVTQKLARHSDPRLTANVYTHLGMADLSRAVEAMPALPTPGRPAAAGG
jgi:integrase